jgi:hypothetical protein
MIVQWKEMWEAMHTLGVHVAPDGNYKNEYFFLKAKADNFAHIFDQDSIGTMILIEL